MGIFSKESPFDQSVDKATLDTNTKEDWALILDICDKVSTSPQAPKECLRSIIRRLNHQDPHVAIQALTLLDACISNCGKSFHLEIASREFEQEFNKILFKTTERAMRDRLHASLEKWALGEFKSDPQLSLIPSLYNRMKANGAEFPSAQSPSKFKKSSSHQNSHKSKSQSVPAASAARQEEDDIAKAIELSLKETQNQSNSKSLYPQVAGVGGGNSGSTASGANNGPNAVVESRKVRALYDFEAAEDNELTFYAGEIVHVTDDTDQNWWQGTNQRGQGLFPANFVTADLSAEPPKLEPAARKSVQFNDEVEVQTVEREPEVVEIDEAKIDRTLHVLHEADPTGETPDPPELALLEDQVQQMGPLIDQELERIDRRHAQLTRLGTELVDALNMYHHLMREVGPPQSMGYNPGMSLAGPQPYHSMPSNMGPPPHGAWQANPYYAPVSFGTLPQTSIPPPMINQSMPQQHVNQQQVTSPTHSSSPLHIPNSQQQQPMMNLPGQMNVSMMPPMMQGQPMMMSQPGPGAPMSMPHLQQDPVTLTTMSSHGQHQHVAMPQPQYPPHQGIQYQIPAPPQQFYQHQPSTNAMM